MKTGDLTSAESVFVRDRNLNVCRNPRFFVVFWLQYSGSAALLCSHRIQSCSGAWHDTNGQKTQNKKKNNIVWSCLIVLERSILMSVWGVESRFQFVCLFVTLFADSGDLFWLGRPTFIQNVLLQVSRRHEILLTHLHEHWLLSLKKEKCEGGRSVLGTNWCCSALSAVTWRDRLHGWCCTADFSSCCCFFF